VVLIGLGSNRGESRRFVVEAMDRLGDFAAGEVRRSHLWQTSPVNCPPGSDDFINAAAAFEPRSGLTPETLLRSLKVLEREYGREPNPTRNAPRELDLDLLLFGDQTRDSADFTLPHPRAVDRLFVLAPSAEVLPDAIWPGVGRTIAELLTDLETDETVVRLEEVIA
jgi:2-amino-4-hydroxy-6-hydroxymethyldihydropteridine diphosphokinase